MRIPERFVKFVDTPSKSMIPITAATVALYGGFSLTPEVRPYTIGVGVLNTIGNIALGIRMHNQEQITRQSQESEQLVEVVPFPLEKSA